MVGHDNENLVAQPAKVVVGIAACREGMLPDLPCDEQEAEDIYGDRLEDKQLVGRQRLQNRESN